MEGRRSQDRRGPCLEELYARSYWPLVRLATLLLDSGEAEDVVQDVFLSLHRRGRLVLRDTDALDGYLRSAVVNACRSSLRRRMAVRRRQRALESAAWLDGSATPSSEHLAEQSIEHRALMEQVAGLPRRQRECLVLRYYLGLTDREVADVLGISAGSVKQHAFRGLGSLRRSRAAVPAPRSPLPGPETVS